MAVLEEYLWLVVVGAFVAFGFGFGTGTHSNFERPECPGRVVVDVSLRAPALFLLSRASRFAQLTGIGFQKMFRG